MVSVSAQTYFLPIVTNPFGFSSSNDLWLAPTFSDLDNDGDYDLLSGCNDGDLIYYENTGSNTNANYSSYNINPFNLPSGVNWKSAPAFSDLDNDGDLDLLVGYEAGGFRYFENIGTNSTPNYSTPVINPYGLTTLTFAKPTFVDIDNDGDEDLFSGALDGKTYYYENIGTITTPNFAPVQQLPFGIVDVGMYSTPAFTDWDMDGDLDLAVNRNTGVAYCFTNTGSNVSPAYTLAGTDLFGIVNVGSSASSPTFVDVDNDGDEDLFVGYTNTTIYFQEFGATSSTINESLCDGATYTSPSGNYTWTNSGAYMDTIQNSVGCDSVISINIITGVETNSSINAVLCPGTSYTSPSGNYTWTTGGTYSDTIPNALGCDSVITVNLTTSNDINCGLVAYYPFDNDATDASGNGNDGIPTDIAYAEDSCDVPLNAAVLDSNLQSRVKIGTGVKPVGFPVALSLWINASDIQSKQVIFRNDKWESGNTYAGFNLRLINGSLSASYGNNGGAGSGSRRTFIADSLSLAPNGWHHIALNINSKTNFELYVDTILIGGTFSGSANYFAYNSTANGFIGVGAASEYAFHGLLDEFRVYDRALTKTDIDSLYNLNCFVDNTSIDELNKNINMHVYPNPTSGNVTIESESQGTLRVRGIDGKVIYTLNHAGTTHLDMGDTPKGVYFITLSNKSHSVTEKVIIQ